MSGGYFDYGQHKISQIADDIELIIENNSSEEVNEWGDRVGHGFSDETIVKFLEAVTQLRRAYVYAQRIDWLVSGDDGEDNFHRRMENDMSSLNASKEE